VRDRVVADLTIEQQKNRATEDAEKCLASIKNGADYIAAAQEFGRDPIVSEHFKRRGSIQDVGFEQEINTAAFKLSDENALSPEVIQGNGGAFVIRLKERQRPSDEDFTGAKAQTQERLKQQKEQQLIAGLVKKLRENSEIEYNLDLDQQ
jgi:hypothetical protein